MTADCSRERWAGLSLLLMPAIFLFVGLALLNLARPDTVRAEHLRGAVAVAGLTILARLVSAWRFRRADGLILPISAMLATVGLVMITRLDPDLGMRQSLWVAAGLLLFIATVAFLPGVSILQSYKYTAAILGLLLIATTFVLGVDPGGGEARLWLGANGLYFQPSEILKVLLVIFLAGYLEDKRELLAWSSSRLGSLKLPPLPYLGPLVVMWGISMLLLIGQRDLGATLLLFGVFLSMLYVASSRAIYVWGGLSAFVMGAYICFLAFSHVRVRVEIWIDPWSRAQEQGYQIVQALVALGSGGLLGSGLGYGSPRYIPAVHTDFVIAAIGEEMGLAATLAVVALFALLVYRGFRVALDASRPFSTLLAAGLTSVLGIQSAVILAGSTKLIPVTGITLPFISYGGSSIATNFVIIALLLHVSAERRESHAP